MLFAFSTSARATSAASCAFSARGFRFRRGFLLPVQLARRFRCLQFGELALTDGLLQLALTHFGNGLFFPVYDVLFLCKILSLGCRQSQ